MVIGNAEPISPNTSQIFFSQFSEKPTAGLLKDQIQIAGCNSDNHQQNNCHFVSQDQYTTVQMRYRQASAKTEIQQFIYCQSGQSDPAEETAQLPSPGTILSS